MGGVVAPVRIETGIPLQTASAAHAPANLFEPCIAQIFVLLYFVLVLVKFAGDCIVWALPPPLTGASGGCTASCGGGLGGGGGGGLGGGGGGGGGFGRGFCTSED